MRMAILLLSTCYVPFLLEEREEAGGAVVVDDAHTLVDQRQALPGRE